MIDQIDTNILLQCGQVLHKVDRLVFHIEQIHLFHGPYHVTS